ncbi:MAG: energy transducer TonB, partial [Pseudomonadota bacterium]
MKTKQFNQYWAGFVSMLFGPVLVFGLVVLMNQYMGKIDRVPAQEVTEISMTKEIKPEPKKEIKKVEPKKQVTRPQAPAPFKGLDTALSGIDLGSLGLDDGQGRGLDDGLLGKTGNAVMTADLVDVPPKPISRGAFKYTPAAKREG